MKLHLVLMDGSKQGHRLTLNLGFVVIGRAKGSDVRLPSERISRRHCRIWLERNKVWVQDLGSQNGTFLNDEVVVGKVELTSGDELKVSHVRFKVELGAATSEKPGKSQKPQKKPTPGGREDPSPRLDGDMDALALVPLDEPTPQDFDLPFEDEEPESKRPSRPAETYDIPITDPTDFRDILRELDEGSED